MSLMSLYKVTPTHQNVQPGIWTGQEHEKLQMNSNYRKQK
jgi:hypothetical protein